MPSNNFKGIIFTNHALKRLDQRKFTKAKILQTINSPDQKFTPEKQKTGYKKKFGSATITVVTTDSDEGKPLVISCWADPPIPGSIDHVKEQFHKDFIQAGIIGKLYLILKRGMSTLARGY